MTTITSEEFGTYRESSCMLGCLVAVLDAHQTVLVLELLSLLLRRAFGVLQSVDQGVQGRGLDGLFLQLLSLGLELTSKAICNPLLGGLQLLEHVGSRLAKSLVLGMELLLRSHERVEFFLQVIGDLEVLDFSGRFLV
jgi:hypothetical protein